MKLENLFDSMNERYSIEMEQRRIKEEEERIAKEKQDKERREIVKEDISNIIEAARKVIENIPDEEMYNAFKEVMYDGGHLECTIGIYNNSYEVIEMYSNKDPENTYSFLADEDIISFLECEYTILENVWKKFQNDFENYYNRNEKILSTIIFDFSCNTISLKFGDVVRGSEKYSEDICKIFPEHGKHGEIITLNEFGKTIQNIYKSYNVPIENLNLEKKLIKKLHDNDIHTIDELIDCSEKILLDHVWGIGEKAITSIKAALSEINLSLKTDE